MSKLALKAEDRLTGSENFTAWKYRILSLCTEHDLEDFITGEVEEPTTAAARAAFKRKKAKARNIILGSVKDNLVPILGPLSTPKECYDALADLFEQKVHTQKRVLKKQLHTLKMEKNDTIATYFSKISQIRDQLVAIGVSVEDDDMVQTAIDGLPTIWGVFLASVNGRETHPNFARLWHDCLEEEGRMNSRKDFLVPQEHALAAKNKRWKKFPKSKGKGKKPTGLGQTPAFIQCFFLYLSNCGAMATTAQVPTSFGRELRACLRCRLIKTYDQFRETGCENCPAFNMDQDHDRVVDCTTSNFSGIISCMDPTRSWSARWLRISRFVPGCYTLAVSEALSEEMQAVCEDNNVQYVPPKHY